MGCYRVFELVAIVSLVVLVPNIHAWGDDGHAIVCKIAQGRLSTAAAAAVKKLLPKSANNDLASKCSWADSLRVVFPWSSALHFANTPDNVCNYKHSRDCVDMKTGIKGRCVVSAITNYTNQLLEYGSETKSKCKCQTNKPLHCGFASDRGGNDINVRWYKRKQNLHHVWDANIIETEVERFYDDIDDFVDAIQQNITRAWADEIEQWENCRNGDISCPAIYASESAKDACAWAYEGASEGSVLDDEYFFSRFPIVNLRLAQGGVRLAATLNRIFDSQSAMSM